MYFLVLFQPTGERAIYQNDKSIDKLTVKNLLEWICERFHFESSSGESGNRRLILLYNNTELQSDWFIQDINIRFGATVKCVVKEERIPDYRLFLSIRNETFDVFDSHLHPIETTILQLRIVASQKSGLPLSAFRLATEKEDELFDHVRLSQYDIDYRATLIIQTWVGWSDFFNYAIKGYTKAVIKLLHSDELVRQYMLQVALYIAAHYGNVDLARALLQLGARADRPVGHHPSRQWCSSDSFHPEYFRCPIHEAIISQQVGIVLLFGSRDVSILQKPDGYGLKPWRLALRQEANPKQHEIALFILTKQFGGMRLSNKITIAHRHIFIFKQWAERARENVYGKQGVQYSSLKRKPLLNNGESLLGYKILVDGYNNDFQDYYSTAEYAKEKLRPACVILDEKERYKLKQTEQFIKRFNEATINPSKIFSISPAPIQQTKGTVPTIITPDSKGVGVGKKLWTKVPKHVQSPAKQNHNNIRPTKKSHLIESLLPKQISSSINTTEQEYYPNFSYQSVNNNNNKSTTVPYAQLMIDSPTSSSSNQEQTVKRRRSSSNSDQLPSTSNNYEASIDGDRSLSPRTNDDETSSINGSKSTRLSRRQYDFLIKLADQQSLNTFIETSSAESGSRWTWRRTSANSRGYKVYYVCNFSMRRHYHPCPAAMYALFHPEGSISIYSCGQHQHIPKDRLPVSITDATKDEIFKCLQGGMSTTEIREHLTRLQLPFGDTRKLNNFIKYHKELLRFGTVTNVRIGGTAYRQPQCWAIRRQPSGPAPPSTTANSNDDTVDT